MEQRKIRDEKKLKSGIYFINGAIQESGPVPALILDYKGTGENQFIIQNKVFLKTLVKRAYFPDVFVAYWYFKNNKAWIYIYLENSLVSLWYIHLLTKYKYE